MTSTGYLEERGNGGCYGGNSHVPTHSQQEGQDTYYTRRTGRTANMLYEYVVWRLKAEQDGKNFECTYGKLPFPFNNAPMKVKASEPNKKKKFPSSVEPYPFSYEKYYKGREKNIRGLFNLSDIHYNSKNNQYDITIHMRFDDIMNDNEDYTLLPLSYYKMCLNRIDELQDARILIIGKADDRSQECLAGILKNKIEQWYPNKSIRVQLALNQTIEQDLLELMTAKTLIASTSSFWFWSAFLSNSVEKVYVPLFGVCGRMDLRDWKKYRPVYLPLVTKIKDIRDFFDTT